MPHRRRKTRWYRGSRYHGWGQIGQHRKSGARGGYGRAGLKKHKWFYVLKYEPDHFGRHGFRSHKPPKKSINIGDLERLISMGVDEINLDELGYEKLLAKGRLSRPIKIIVKEASERAVEKVKEAGGEVILLKG
jgi:large subunit ribosomal protein L15